MIVLRELSRYKLDIVGVQEVRWKGGGTKPAGKYTFFYRKSNENQGLGTWFLCITIISAVKKAEFISDMMLQIRVRGHWCYIIFLKVHAP
jgi:hypothetical protein